MLVAARANLWKAQERLGVKPSLLVIINDFFAFKFYEEGEMPWPPGEEPESSDGPYLKCSMSPENLRRILTREAIWNNLEVAGDILYDRRPNIYNPDVFTLMNFFQLPRE